MLKKGINVRHIGLVRSMVGSEQMKTVLLTEIIARVLKDRVKQLLRETMEKTKLPSTEPYRIAVTSLFNNIFIINIKEFWKSVRVYTLI